MRKTGLVRVRMWLRVEYVQLVFILTIPNDTRKSIFLPENEMIDYTRMLKRCIHDAWFKWYWQGACQVDKTSWRFGNWFDLNGRKSVMVFWKWRNFVMSAYLYRASMHKKINIIEKWGYVLFEMMKVHEKYRYMQISTENWNIFLKIFKSHSLSEDLQN